MKKMIGLLSLSGALVACGGFSGDGTLYLTNPQIQTEYYVGSPSGKIYVGCDFVDGSPQSTAVRMHFDFSGTLSELSMEWRGVTTSDHDQFGSFGANQIESTPGGGYYVTFEAEAYTRPTPFSVRPSGITVVPTFAPKQVRVDEAPIGAFFARAVGVAASGSSTTPLESPTVNVYQNCFSY